MDIRKDSDIKVSDVMKNHSFKPSNSSKKVLSNSAIYAVSGILQKCFSFFLLPLYTSFLSTEDYGITNVASGFLNTMSFIVSLSLYSAVMRFYVDYKNDGEKLKRFYGTVITFVFISSVFFICVLSIAHTALSTYVFKGIDFFPKIAICLLSLGFFCQHEIYDSILRSQQKAVKCSVLTILYFLITVSCNILFVVHYKMGANGVLLSTLISTFLYTCYFLIDIFIKKSVTICIDIKLLKEALRYSIPIIPHNLSTKFVELFSIVLIGGTKSLGVVGIYSIAAQFGGISDALQNYVNQAYTPWLFDQLKCHNDGFRETISRVARVLRLLFGFIFVCIGLFSQDYIFIFLDKSYMDAWHYVPLVVIVYSIKIPYYFYVSMLLYYKQASKKLFIATVSGSLVNVLLSAFAIPRWGAYGSIAADAVAMVIRVAIVYCIGSRYENIGLYLKDFVKSFCLILVVMTIGLLPSYYNNLQAFSISNFLYKTIIVLVCFVCLYAFNRKEIKRILDSYKHKG